MWFHDISMRDKETYWEPLYSASRSPPENMLSAEVGNLSESRISTFLVRSLQLLWQSEEYFLGKRTTSATETLISSPKSRASQGAASCLVWHKSAVRSSMLLRLSGPSVIPSIHFSPPVPSYLWLDRNAATGWSSTWGSLMSWRQWQQSFL